MEEQKLFSVNEGYKIGLIFLTRLMSLLEHKAREVEKDQDELAIYTLFFHEVCSGFESSPEWFEAVFRAKHASREEQKSLLLTELELFSCTLEFSKLHNERWENQLCYLIDLLESMQKQPEQHPLKWEIWEKVKQHVAAYPNTFYNVDWSVEPLFKQGEGR